MTMIDLEARAHGSRVLTDWAASRPGAAARMGFGLRNDVTDSSEVIKSSDRRVLDLFGIGTSAAGMAVTAESAMRVSAVFACVRIISCAMASMPIHIYKRIGAGDRARVNDSDLWYLLNEQPTPRYSAASLWEKVGAFEQLRGDDFAYIGRSRSGAIKEVVPMPWGGVRVERDQTDSHDRLKYYLQDGMRTWGADQDDVLHFPGFGFNGMRGMSVLQYAARNAAGTAMAMDEYSGRFFAGGAHPSVVLSTEKTMGEKLIKDLREQFAERYSGVQNAHRLPLVLTEGMKVDTLSLTAEDAQLLEGRKFQVVDIARAFGVPPHLIGETSASTSWGTGIEAMGRAFVTFSLQPHLIRIEQELNRKLFRSSEFFLEFNRDALLEGDSQGQAKLFRAAIGGPGQGPGWMSIDEVRKVKNLPPLGGRNKQVYFPPEKATPTTKPEDDDEDPETAAAAA